MASSPEPQPLPQGGPPSDRRPSLTTSLLNGDPDAFGRATRHPFLRRAGEGSLPKAVLSRWLSQDRLYAQSYIGFIGALIARVDLPEANTEDKTTSLRWRIVELLTGALQNIHTELDFFAATAQKYGLQLDAAPTTEEDQVFTAEPATRQYVDLFRAFGTDPGMGLLEGLVVLWATEVCYLSAWTYAKSFTESSHGDDDMEADDKSAHTSDLDGGALRDAFIPNWTSPDFRSFVAEIADVTDQLARREDAVTHRFDVYRAVWRHILDVERRFWPDVEASTNKDGT